MIAKHPPTLPRTPLFAAAVLCHLLVLGLVIDTRLHLADPQSTARRGLLKYVEEIWTLPRVLTVRLSWPLPATRDRLPTKPQSQGDQGTANQTRKGVR